ncbi:MAG: SEC-C metal-binding domain-containing protein [Pseudomonadota bacterium]
MSTTLELDPSQSFQIADDILVLWLPRSRGRDARSEGLIATVDICKNPSCKCTEARLQAWYIDDHVKRAVRRRDGHLVLIRLAEETASPPRAKGFVKLTIDFVTGTIQGENEAKAPTSVAPFFEEPLPYWVLDHMWARWLAPRLKSAIDWKARAFKYWEPGSLLSTMLVFPEDRPDCYLVDGKMFQADTLFCVEPKCACTDAHFDVFQVDDSTGSLREVCVARLSSKTTMPVEFKGSACERELLTRIHGEWCRRNVPASARLRELRDRTRQRGHELLQLAARRGPCAAPASQHPAPPIPQAAPASRPKRNVPCPCGSGKKYKRCCGR